MASSRQRILEHLKRADGASVAELSRALDLTAVTIRHHLSALIEDELVDEPVARRRRGPGRPEMVYRCTQAANSLMPRNFGELSSRLLHALSDSEAEALLIELAERETPVGGHGVGSAVAFLEPRGYLPVALGDNAIRLCNCPYLEVAQETRILCRYDAVLVERLSGSAVEVTGRIVDGDTCCTMELAGPVPRHELTADPKL